MALDPEAMSATVVRRGSDAESYGRHAAPPSAYGPADVHRLPPVAPSRLRPVEWVDGGDAAVDAIDDAVVAEAVAATGARSSGEVPARATGFLARLRLLPRAA
ncbi:hypothetical protein [Blastococcus sp. SYSU DS1024]